MLLLCVGCVLMCRLLCMSCACIIICGICAHAWALRSRLGGLGLSVTVVIEPSNVSNKAGKQPEKQAVMVVWHRVWCGTGSGVALSLVWHWVWCGTESGVALVSLSLVWHWCSTEWCGTESGVALV